jgi:hypothetical protein
MINRVTEARRKLVLSVPLHTACERLQNAFALPIMDSKSPVFPHIIYSGQINGRVLHVKFSISGMSFMNFKMLGKIKEVQGRTELRLVVREEVSLIFLFALLVSEVFIITRQSIGIMFFLAAFLALFAFAIQSWRRNEAADILASLVQKVITDSSLEPSYDPAL